MRLSEIGNALGLLENDACC